MRRNSSTEIEIKLPVSSAAALRRALKRLHARIIVGRTYEYNTLYDTTGKDMTRRSQLIRLRIERAAAKVSRLPKQQTAILTYKGPSKKLNRRFKIREEFEVIVDSGEQIIGILRALNLHPSFQYEKFRTTYGLPGLKNAKIELDETPIGVFLELEGLPSAIDRAAARLGYSKADYLTETYGDLYIADCGRRKTRPGNMLFPATKMFR